MASPSNKRGKRARTPQQQSGQPKQAPGRAQEPRSATQRAVSGGTATLIPPGASKPAQGSSDAPDELTLTTQHHIVVPRIPDQSPLIGNTGTPQSTTDVEATANLLLRYITSVTPMLAMQFGTPYGFNQAAGIHALPIYIDELERDWGTDIYRRMTYDATVKSADATLRAGILDKPLQVTPACDEDQEDDQAKVQLAQDIADFVQANLDTLDMASIGYQMLDGISMGYKLGEMRFEVREIIKGNGPQTCLEGIYPLPQEATTIICDQYNELLGYMPRLAGSGLVGNFTFGDLGLRTVEHGNEVDIPGLVPPEKVMRFTWQEQDGMPTGISHLRAAYIPWRMKIGIYPAWEAYLVRFAQPSAAWELEGADLPTVMDSNGRVVTDAEKILSSLLATLNNWQAGGTMVAPIGHVHLEESHSDGEPYLKAFEYVDEQITVSILGSNLSTQGGKYGTQALGSVHQDTSGLPVSMGKDRWARCVRDSAVTMLVLLNYGEEGLELLPYVSSADTEQQDFPVNATAVSTLKGAGLLLPEQYNWAFEKLGMPPLENATIAMLNDQYKRQQEAATTAAENPMGTDPNAQGGDGSQGDGSDQSDPFAGDGSDGSIY